MQDDKPTFSLRWKIVLIVCATAGLSAMLIATVSYYSMRTIARDKAVSQLAHEAQVAALSLVSQYTQIKNDLFAVSRTTGATRLMEGIRNGGSHPDDGASLDTLRTRLGTTFSRIMADRPYYTQMRYIGMADNGRELVRVNRLPDGSLAQVPPSELQEKGGEFYFKESLGLPAGAFYLSKAAYNREHGATDSTFTPTIRMLVPTFTATGERFGMIIINAHYGMLLKEVLRDLPPAYEIYVLDRYGDYIRRDSRGNVAELEISGAYRAQPPKFIEDLVADRLSEGRFDINDKIGYSYRFSALPDQRHGGMAILVLAPHEMLTADANRLIGENMTIAAVITLIAGLIAAFLADVHTWPIRRITAAIETFGRRRGQDLDLPVDALDEVGVMARAFRNLVESLELSQQRNQALSLQLDTFIMNAADGIVIIDERGTIEEINTAVLEIFGYRRDEMIGRNVSVLMPDVMAAKHDTYLRDYLVTGRQTFMGAIREVQARAKDGRILPLAISVSEMLLPDKRRVFGAILRDMSELHEAQKSVAVYMAELERSNHELDQFAYIASHDLKAPLRVIDNASQWLEEDLRDKLTEDDLANMTLLRGRVRRMEKLLDDLLEYSRIGKVQDGRYRETVTLSRLVDDVLLLLEPPPSMEIVVPPEFGRIEVYRMPLQRVLYNLVNNAIKHHDRAEGVIELSVEDHPDRYVFAVTDDGPGIPPAYHEQIFELFRTLKPRDQVEGSGMGLAMVKKTVESSGGQIAVEAAGERGSIFRFSWPKAVAGALTQATGKAA